MICTWPARNGGERKRRTECSIVSVPSHGRAAWDGDHCREGLQLHDARVHHALHARKHDLVALQHRDRPVSNIPPCNVAHRREGGSDGKVWVDVRLLQLILDLPAPVVPRADHVGVRRLLLRPSLQARRHLRLEVGSLSLGDFLDRLFLHSVLQQTVQPPGGIKHELQSGSDARGRRRCRRRGRSSRCCGLSPRCRCACTRHPCRQHSARDLICQKCRALRLTVPPSPGP